mmetsp:Transcript_51808/g.167091  ORF Transcript_51808/g.167091 Transcript_51808/m.167091 type:complete len:217 (+) Transcript_51808:154-804(+)
MFAPAFRFPPKPYSTAAAWHSPWILVMTACSSRSTVSASQLTRCAFCAISIPLTATPPALDALAGPKMTPRSSKRAMASGVDGMLAPSKTPTTPLATRAAPSASSISFCVAEGNAMSAAIDHGRSPSRKTAVGLSRAYSETRPPRFCLTATSWASCSSVKPSGSCTVPSESEKVSTLAPSASSFLAVNCATLPEPETSARLPAMCCPCASSAARAK